MTTKDIKDYIGGLPLLDTVGCVLAADANNNMQKASFKAISQFALIPQPCSQDLDNPTFLGIFVMNPNSQITRPTKGSGWNYGYVFNLATDAGLQFWINYDGYLAIRGKTAVGAPWQSWSVTQRL